MNPEPRLAHAVPWVSRPGIAPRAWQHGPRLWLESNGSDGCYGGWELVFPVPPGSVPPDVERLTRGPDEPVVEAFWHSPDGTEVDWEPVGVSASSLCENGATVRFATRLRHPPGATRLSVRCGLRWSPRGCVAWHGWAVRWQPTPPRRRLRLGADSGGARAGVNPETAIRTRFVDRRAEPVAWPAAGPGRS
jgi:hypothetical protein